MVQRNIVLDFSKSAGKMKPIFGLNGGPLATPSLGVDLSEKYREMAIPAVRTAAHPGERVIDVHTVFPDFRLDERFEASFNFAPTDAYLKAIKDAGCEIYLRLGESPEPYEIKRRNRLPANPEKWASVCERIIAHYNEGWGRGMKLGIKYVEIMCDVDEPDFLSSPTRYYEFYRVVANRLRARFPRIKLGAYSSGGFYSLNHFDPTEAQRGYVDYLDGFLSYVSARDTAAPLDFLSWKCFAETPEELSLHSNYAKNYLVQHGLKRTASVVSEFNLAPLSTDSYKAKDYPARLLASLILAQKSDLSMLFYADGNPESDRCALYSLEDRHGVHTYAAYRAMCAFGTLAKMKNTVLSSEDYRHVIYSLGATDGERGAILLVTDDYNGIIELTVMGAEFSTYSIRGIIGGGERGDGYSTSAENVKLVDGRVRMRAGKNEVYLITLE